jgi:hypothetical protein
MEGKPTSWQPLDSEVFEIIWLLKYGYASNQNEKRNQTLKSNSI